jgi:hypothetical protein
MTEPTASFPTALADWTDFDTAAFELGRALGVFTEADSFQSVKGVFWSSSPLGTALDDTLRALVAGGILEDKPDDDTIYRWNQTQPGRRPV